MTFFNNSKTTCFHQCHGWLCAVPHHE